MVFNSLSFRFRQFFKTFEPTQFFNPKCANTVLLNCGVQTTWIQNIALSCAPMFSHPFLEGLGSDADIYLAIHAVCPPIENSNSSIDNTHGRINSMASSELGFRRARDLNLPTRCRHVPKLTFSKSNDAKNSSIRS